MANVIIDDTYLSDIADAIRAKTGGSDTFTPAQMATAIGNISVGTQEITPSLLQNSSSLHPSSLSTGFDWSYPDTVHSTAQITSIVMIKESSTTLRTFVYHRWAANKLINSGETFRVIPLTQVSGSELYWGSKYITNTTVDSTPHYFLPKETIFTTDAGNDVSWKSLPAGGTLHVEVNGVQNYVVLGNTDLPSYSETLPGYYRVFVEYLTGPEWENFVG